MDVPTRQSYVMASCSPEERLTASGVTSLVRLGGWAVAPAFAGALMQSHSLALRWSSARRSRSPTTFSLPGLPGPQAAGGTLITADGRVGASVDEKGGGALRGRGGGPPFRLKRGALGRARRPASTAVARGQ